MKKSFICKKCEKEFNSRATMFRHQKNCVIENNIIQDKVNNELQELKQKLQEKDMEIERMKMEIEKERFFNTTLQSKLDTLELIFNKNNISQPQSIIQPQPQSQSIIQQQPSKTFSVKDYLNNECSNPYSIKEAIDMVKYDITTISKDSYVAYKKFCDKLFEILPIEKLPIRCSDINRRMFYGFVDGKWIRPIDIWEDFIKLIISKMVRLYVEEYPIPEEKFSYLDIRDGASSSYLKDNEKQTDIKLSILNLERDYNDGNKTDVNNLIKHIVDKTEIIKD